MITSTLSNGIRVILEPSTSDVVYCGIAIDSGTRDELPEESGMAHFTEHLSFKGTQRRRSWHIINRMESVGGDLNAYTGKEETVYYCTTLLPHLPRAIDLLLDITLASTYPQTEMDKEVEVVEDEIESYNDSPSELIFDDFEAILFKDHPLGRNILGVAQRLRQYRTDDILRYVRRQYLPSRMVLYVLGNTTLPTILRIAEKTLSTLSPLSAFSSQLSANPLSARTPFSFQLSAFSSTRTVLDKDTHQSHVMIGNYGYGAQHPRHLALYLLNNILGGPGMNSRLNLALRERNGLVYTVESNLTTYTDTGVWCIYFGCNPEDVERCIRLTLRELRRLTDAPLTEAALRAAKRQIIGQIGISYDNKENLSIGMAKRFLHYNTTLTHDELCQRINALTAHDLWQTAQEVFNPDTLQTLIYK